MALYIGSDNVLPLIEWREGEPLPIDVRELDLSIRDDAFAASHLTKKYQYFVGCWQGCGCGFRFDYTCEQHDNEYNDLGKQSLEALFTYISENVSGDSCELYSFWMGGRSLGDFFSTIFQRHKKSYGVEHKDETDLKTFVLGDRFEFYDKQYITVYK